MPLTTRMLPFLFATACSAAALAQVGGPAPLDSRTAGLLVADLSLDKIYFTKDRNGDGDAQDAGEVHVFFDDTNSSGNLILTGSLFWMFQSRDGSIYVGEGSGDAVIRLFDLNGDNDAQDAGEASLFFESGASMPDGFLLSSPNGIWEDADGYLYVVNAGASSTPDGVYRLKDLNGDGDAHDAGESSLYFDLQNLILDSGGAPRSSAFGCVTLGDALYVCDLIGGEPDAILRAVDADLSGSIGAGEFGKFITDDNAFGVQVGIPIATDGTAIYTAENLSSQDQNIWRLSDVNGNGEIDAASEAEVVWNEAGVPTPFVHGNNNDIAFGPGGRLAVTGGGATEADNVFVLTDGNGDNDYLDAGETAVWVTGGLGSGDFADNPRAVEFIRCSSDVDNNGVTDVFDLLAFLGDWFGSAADWNGDNVTDVFDLLGYLAAWFNRCA